MEDFLINAATVAAIGSLILVSLLFLCFLFCLGKLISDWIVEKAVYRKSYYRRPRYYTCKGCSVVYISEEKFKETVCPKCGTLITKKDRWRLLL